ncbi:MAG: ATP-binding protein [[Clostridium] fimetarium]|nr:ATP-binding protein [Alistipes timonensis]MCM1406481.1 ATP-binding protein [[Clostridium] fimetarium]
MKFQISNLGPIGSAEIEPAPLTIICGKNNTGKTYVSYSYFGFVDYFNNGALIKLPDDICDELVETGSVKIDLGFPQYFHDLFFKNISENLSIMQPIIFAAEPSHFKRTSVNITISAEEIVPLPVFRKELNAGSAFSMSFSKLKEDDFLTITLLKGERFSELEARDAFKPLIQQAAGEAVKHILFSRLVPTTTFASAERTGALMFRDELTKEKGSDIGSLIDSHPGDLNGLVEDVSRSLYPIPVIKNIDFIKKLRSIALRESPLAKSHPEIVEAFDKIAGGRYVADDNGVYFSPADNASLKLAMEESSSSARSLVIMSFWLRHLARKGDMIMIDEPEMNLHPEGQRMLARWVAMLVNNGVKVFMTTHSDYLIKELNNLIMLYARRRSDSIRGLMDKNDIAASMLLKHDALRVYVAKRPLKKGKDGTVTLGKTVIEQAPIDKRFGVEVSSFDDTINRINELQEAIVFNG